jgi:hypothetical protein
MTGDIFLFERDGAPPVRAERLAFGETAGRNEAWLRNTLFANPDLMPLRDLDPTYGPINQVLRSRPPAKRHCWNARAPASRTTRRLT